MSDFQRSVDFVLKEEGGFVDNPDDRGGPTNFGITQETLEDFLGKSVTLEDVKNLPVETAKDIYHRNYWDQLHLDDIGDNALATVCFSLAVLKGVPTVVRAIQQACGVPVDGRMGARTLQAFRGNASVRAAVLAKQIIFMAQRQCAELVVADPTQLKFLLGWMDRMQNLLGLVLE